jgi:hypothetical protein
MERKNERKGKHRSPSSSFWALGHKEEKKSTSYFEHHQR